MTNTAIFPYRIPDIYFRPHKVISPFYAKVIYKIEDGKGKILEVGLSARCLEIISGTCYMIVEMQKELNEAIRKAAQLAKMQQTFTQQ